MAGTALHEGSLEKGEHCAPAIALILDETLEDAKRGRVAGGVDVVDPTQQGGRVPETCGVKKARDFELGLRARL